jgi:hypothetical protein
MKTCFKCGGVKPLDDFYRHARMGDGHLNKCKDCTRHDVRRHRSEHVSRVREYDRQRSRLPHRAALRARTTRDWRLQHRDRSCAHQKAARAAKKGLIARPRLCAGCGGATKLQMHHPDYHRPTLVMWLCKPCHAIADKVRRVTEAKSA